VNYTFTVPVTNPQLWNLTTPNMYTLTTSVLINGTAVDDDVQDFGIREIIYNNGMTINGVATKLKGTANHQDLHGLGMAAPQRAMQRRLAALKSIGCNAFRTAHDPPSPDFLALTDRMGILVMDEFADVWTEHKYTDVGDYALYFNTASTTPTGMPPLPTSAKGTKWWEVDFSGYIMRDRNHPSVALFSVGNEIHDSIGVRTPILTEMVAIQHELDQFHNITQALLNPATSGDYPGTTTSSLVDVWGDNYDVTTCVAALKTVATTSGVITEEGSETSTWTTVTGNTGLMGEFIWTGVDYLGEANLQWPQIGGTGALIDSLGNVRAGGRTWAGLWGGTPPAAGAAGTTASKIVLTADHTSIVTDLNDVSYVKAAISDANGNTVTGSNASVTFAITGPGTIIAVDSASMTNSSFRGDTRAAYEGLVYAIVQATGAGTITVTATSTGLTSGTATITATAGTFVPCASAATCN